MFSVQIILEPGSRIAAGEFDFIEDMLPPEAKHMFDSSVDYKNVIDRSIQKQTSGIGNRDDAFSDAYLKLSDTKSGEDFPRWAQSYGRHVVSTEAEGRTPAPLEAYISRMVQNVASDWKQDFSIQTQKEGPQVSLSSEASEGGSSMEGLISDPSAVAPAQGEGESRDIREMREFLAQNVSGWNTSEGEPGLPQEVFGRLMQGMASSTDTRRVGPTPIAKDINMTRPESDKVEVPEVSRVLSDIRHQMEVFQGGDPTKVEDVPEAPGPGEDILEAPVTLDEVQDVPGPEEVPIEEGTIYDPTNKSLWTPAGTGRGRFFTPNHTSPVRANDIALSWFEPEIVGNYPERKYSVPEWNMKPRWVFQKNSKKRPNAPRGMSTGSARIHDLDEDGNVSDRPSYVVPLAALGLDAKAKEYRTRRRIRVEERRDQQEMRGE